MTISYYSTKNAIPAPILPNQKLPQTKKINLKSLSPNAHMLRDKIYQLLSKKRPNKELIDLINQYIEELTLLKQKEGSIKHQLPDFSWKSGFILKELDILTNVSTSRVQLFKGLGSKKKKHGFVSGNQLDLELFMILWTKVLIYLHLRGTKVENSIEEYGTTGKKAEIESLSHIISVLDFLEEKIRNHFSLEYYRILPEMHVETVRAIKYYCKGVLEILILGERVQQDLNNITKKITPREIADMCSLIIHLFDQAQRNLLRLSHQIEKIYHTQLDEKLYSLMIQYRIYFRYLLFVYYSIDYHDHNKIGHACTLSLTGHKQLQELKVLLTKCGSIIQIISKTELANHLTYSEQLASRFHHENVLLFMDGVVPLVDIHIKVNFSKITEVPKYELQSWMNDSTRFNNITSPGSP